MSLINDSDEEGDDHNDHLRGGVGGSSDYPIFSGGSSQTQKRSRNRYLNLRSY